MRKALETQVRARARNRCEYCHLPEAMYLFRFQIDHIIAEQHEGRTISSNLCLACPRCNAKKGPNIAGRARGGRVIRLFNPRRDQWTDHFRWNGPVIQGRTPVRRATIAVLEINEPSAVEFRRELMKEGRFERL
jgi:hypothetical protein